MPLYLTLFEGATVQTAQPLVATQDPRLIEAFIRELAERLEPTSSRQVVPFPGTARRQRADEDFGGDGEA